MTAWRMLRVALPTLIVSLLLTVVLSTAHAAVIEPPVLLGIYPNGNLITPGGLDEIIAIDAWIQSEAGLGSKGISIAATFIDPEIVDPVWSVTNELEMPWDNGYVPFVNLMTTHTSTAIAGGAADAALTAWANAFKSWAGTTKRAFIAPMPEMNGTWTVYSESPANFKLAFIRIQAIFADAGVPDSAVSWVFAPNYVSIGRPAISDYYPGNSVVDVVGFSAYNYADCVAGGSWGAFSFNNLFKPALDAMRALAPSKPIFITQTGVLPGVSGNQDRSAWLNDVYTQLAAYPAVRAVLYFHRDNGFSESNLLPCRADYRVFGPTFYAQGFLDAIQASDFEYWSPSDPEWASTAFTPGPQGTFDDVWPAHPFSGVEDAWYNQWVYAISASGLTAGCSTSQYSIPAFGYTLDLAYYCPFDTVTRAEMAVFLLKGINGSGYVPPALGGSPFIDIVGHWAEAWIEQLGEESITAGYPDGTFRPNNSVTRAEMAIFLLKAKYGASYTPPAPGGGVFTDIDGHWAQAWIEQLKAEGITSGYDEGDGTFTYRPENFVDRAEMAVFLVQTFSLPVP